MKGSILILLFFSITTTEGIAQVQPKTNVLKKTENSISKIKSAVAVFQPYFLKARQLFFDTKALASEIKNAKMNMPDNSNTETDEAVYAPIQNYLPEQSLPINNDATINDDGTGNWGNQNNGLYGNCLDVMTGTVMGLGEAEETPQSVDLIFIAANGSFQLWSPDYARNQVAAEYTSRSTHESVSKWNDVNETQVAETKLTGSQFDKIQNNGQILNAVKNAPNYASSLTMFGKLEGKVFAVKVELENRTVYGLIRVVKHYGTEGSNGYLKIEIKSQGISDSNDQVQADAYLR